MYIEPSPASGKTSIPDDEKTNVSFGCIIDLVNGSDAQQSYAGVITIFFTYG